MSRGRLKPLRRRGVRIALVAAVLVVLAGSATFYVARYGADRLHMVVRALPWANGARYSVALDTTIDDANTVRKVQDVVNSLPAVPTGQYYNCGPNGGTTNYTYSLSFTWHGVQTETADADTNGCGFWNIRLLGVSSAHFRPDPNTWHTLERLTGMPGPE